MSSLYFFNILIYKILIIKSGKRPVLPSQKHEYADCGLRIALLTEASYAACTAACPCVLRDIRDQIKTDADVTTSIPPIF